MKKVFPSYWIDVQLSDIVNILENGNRPKGGVRGINAGIPSIGAEHLNSEGGFNFTNIKYIPIDFYHTMKRGHIQQDDILVVKDGATTGKTSFITDKFPYKTAVINEHVFLLRCSIYVSSSYVFRYLWSKAGQSRMLANFQGAAQGGMNRSFLTNTRITLPPLREQKCIANKIDHIMPKIDAVKERLERIPQIVKRFRQSVLMAAVTGNLTERWREEHPEVENAEVFFKRNKFGNLKKSKTLKTRTLKRELSVPEIPKKWVWINLPEVGELARGKSKHRPRNAPFLFGGKYPFIQTGDVAQSNGYITSHKQTYSEKGLKQSKLWPESTICITIAANIAASAILTYPACFPDSVVGIINNPKLCERNFIIYYLKTIKENLSMYAPATAQKNINLSILNKVLFPLPTLKEQREIVRQVDKLFTFADKVEEHYRKAKDKIDRLSQSVLAKAFRGELVPQDPKDEPAKKLLERIKEEKMRLETELKKNRSKNTAKTK